MLKDLNAKSFSEQIGTTFSISEGLPEPLLLKLYEVTETDSSPALEQFSLLFHGPLSPVMPQRTAKLEHERLGSLDIFLVPIGPDEEGMRYQSIFSRFRNKV